METLFLLVKTVLLRPYVFLFLAAFLMSGKRVLGWRRTCLLLVVTWAIAFVCELSSTRIGIPFGDYFYTGTTIGQELYLANVPFMDSLSFPFLLYASYCLALYFLAPVGESSEGVSVPGKAWTAWPTLGLATLFFALIDVIIDPVALRGDRWFLGRIYGYAEAGIYFGVPLSNFAGWAVVGLLSLFLYRILEPFLPQSLPRNGRVRTGDLLGGCGLYYSVLVFNLAVTFWIGEFLLGVVGILIYLPITILLLLKVGRYLPFAAPAAGGPRAVPHYLDLERR